MLLIALLACTPKAQDIVDPPPPPDPCAWAPTQTWQDNEPPQAIRRAFRQERLGLGAEGLAWAVLEDGEIRYADAVGFADEEEARDMAVTTLMRNGSTLKMQTAAAALAQEAKGVLTRDDTLADHLPDFDMAANPGVAGQATLHELLSHQGGFYDYTPIDGPAGENALYNQAHDLFAADYWMMTEPGNFWNYSNPNFGLAGLVAQEASGTPYRQLMRDDLWAPLCMNRSFFEADDVIADGDFAKATSYDWETGIGTRRVGPRSYDHGFSAPAGFGWTSVLDMLHFAQFLMEGNPDVMPRELSDAITTGQVDTLDLPDALIEYGYGINVEPGYVSGFDWRETPIWRHNGAIPGYSAEIVIHPGSGVAVAILSNSDGAYYSDGIAAVFDTLVDPPTQPFPENTFDPATFDRYAGTYDDPFNVGRFEIGVDGDTLTLDAPDLDALGIPYGTTLTPVGLHNFVGSIQGSQLVLTFVDDDDGEPAWIRHRAFVVERSDVATSTHRPTREDLEPVLEAIRSEPRLR